MKYVQEKNLCKSYFQYLRNTNSLIHSRGIKDKASLAIGILIIVVLIFFVMPLTVSDGVNKEYFLSIAYLVGVLFFVFLSQLALFAYIRRSSKVYYVNEITYTNDVLTLKFKENNTVSIPNQSITVIEYHFPTLSFIGRYWNNTHAYKITYMLDGEVKQSFIPFNIAGINKFMLHLVNQLRFVPDKTRFSVTQAYIKRESEEEYLELKTLQHSILNPDAHIPGGSIILVIALILAMVYAFLFFIR